MRKLFIKFLIIFLLSIPGLSSATDFYWYFSHDASGNLAQGSDSNDCSVGSPCQSLSKAETLINSITNETDSAHAYFDCGDTWTLSSFTSPLRIRRSNVYVDSYGIGNRPIIDGQNTYPSDGGIQTAAISIGDSNSGATINNVNINNIEIRNLSDGSTNPDSKGIGIIFYGSGGGGYFTGPGSVTNCKITDVGWSAIGLYRVPNHLGTDYAIKIEKNWIQHAGWYAKTNGGTGPQAVNANDGWSSGHEARYNYIYQGHHEGIGARGFAVVEYNVIIDTNNPCIYNGLAQSYDTGNESFLSSIIRYNLCLNTSNYDWTGDSNRGGGIWVNDEKSAGDNSEIHDKIYGNIVIGSQYGIGIKNNPEDVEVWSNIGLIEVYNNLLIDNKYNFSWNHTDRFDAVNIKNNVSIVSTDAASHTWGSNTGSAHLMGWNDTDWSAWNIGPNFFYGLGWDENADIEDYAGTTKTAWQHADNVFGTVHPLPKTSGWLDGTIATLMTFSNMYPASGSEIVDRWETVVLSEEFQQFLTTGTDWSTAGTSTPAFVLVDQDDHGDDWDFGAIIFFDSAAINEATTGIYGRTRFKIYGVENPSFYGR